MQMATMHFGGALCATFCINLISCGGMIVVAYTTLYHIGSPLFFISFLKCHLHQVKFGKKTEPLCYRQKSLRGLSNAFKQQKPFYIVRRISVCLFFQSFQKLFKYGSVFRKCYNKLFLIIKFLYLIDNFVVFYRHILFSENISG